VLGFPPALGLGAWIGAQGAGGQGILKRWQAQKPSDKRCGEAEPSSAGRLPVTLGADASGSVSSGNGGLSTSIDKAAFRIKNGLLSLFFTVGKR
jgi:hypothetical protein